MKTRTFFPYIVRLVILFSLLTIGMTGCELNAPQKVKVVVFHPTIKTSEEYSQAYVNEAKLALRDAGGKAGNVEVEFIFLDESDPEKQMTSSVDVVKAKLEEVLKDPSVVAVMGIMYSGEAKQVMPMLNEASVTQIGIVNTWPGLTKLGYAPGEPAMYYPTGKRHYFRVTPSDDLQGLAAAQWAQELGYDNIYIVYTDDGYGKGIAGLFENAARDRGLTIVGKEISPPDLSDESAQALAARILDAKPGVVYIAGNPPIQKVAIALRQSDPRFPILGSDGLETGLMPPELIDGIYKTSPSLSQYTAALTPAGKKYLEDYEKTFNIKPGGMLMYDATRALLMAIANAKTPTREGVLEAMYNLGDIPGLYKTWHFDENGDTSINTISAFTFQDGKRVFLKMVDFDK